MQPNISHVTATEITLKYSAPVESSTPNRRRFLGRHAARLRDRRRVSVRESLELLLAAEGCQVETFASSDTAASSCKGSSPAGEQSHAALLDDAEMLGMRTCYASLTPREREVMALVVSGLLNKQVARELGVSEITVKAHDDSLPELKHLRIVGESALWRGVNRKATLVAAPDGLVKAITHS